MQHTSTPLVGTDPASRVKLLEALGKYSQIVSVASAAARNALAATVTPTAAQPLWVWRQDLGFIEMTTDGTTWRAFRGAPATTGVVETFEIGGYAPGWEKTSSKIYAYRGDGWGWLEGTVRRASGSSSWIFTLPAGWRPAVKVIYPTTTLNPGNTSGPPMDIEVLADGTVNAQGRVGTNWEAGTWINFPSTPYMLALT